MQLPHNVCFNTVNQRVYSTCTMDSEANIPNVILPPSSRKIAKGIQKPTKNSDVLAALITRSPPLPDLQERHAKTTQKLRKARMCYSYSLFTSQIPPRTTPSRRSSTVAFSHLLALIFRLLRAILAAVSGIPFAIRLAQSLVASSSCHALLQMGSAV